MDAEQMLATLDEHGQEAGSDYSDSDEFPGWFAWELTRAASAQPILTITYTGDDYDDDGHNARPPVTRRWVLTEIEES
jgi:hypothetical protein